MSTNLRDIATPARPQIRIGLPYGSKGKLHDAAQQTGGNILLSTGSMHRRAREANEDGERPWYFTKMGAAAWTCNAALDSAGFVAMLQGGYRWSVAEYVEWVVSNGGDSDNAGRPFPWAWWSAMDYCCEEEIAGSLDEVQRRISMTVASYGEHLAELEHWRSEGVTDVPDPMPILQGRTAADYIRCARELVQVIRNSCPCTCPDGDEWCSAQWHRSSWELPKLVGLGSVCRRDLHGPEGLLTILEALDAELPEGVRLHLFGVKGDALPHIVARFAHRIESIDSMAWDYRAKKESCALNAAKARELGLTLKQLKKTEHWTKNSVEHRAGWMRRWHAAQVRKIEESPLGGPSSTHEEQRDADETTRGAGVLPERDGAPRHAPKPQREQDRPHHRSDSPYRWLPFGASAGARPAHEQRRLHPLDQHVQHA